ncbi:MAG: T9SS type A sorting domain-containing protein [Calditrichaceae bacterium]|jgi:hypothetical protein
MFRNFIFVILFLISLFIINLPLNAQITIESSEYDVSPGQTNTFYTLEDTTAFGIDVNVGTTNGPQVWNFTLEQYSGGYTDQYTVVDPASTPYADDFPDADHVWLSQQGDSLSMYQFFNLTSDNLFLDGTVFVFLDSAFVSQNDPPENIIKFPAQMNQTWTYTNTDQTEYAGYVIIDSTDRTSVIDAWGTINLPAGAFDCLRVRELETEISTTLLNNVPLYSDTTRYLSYTWIGKTYGLLASISALDNETNLEFTKASDITFKSNINTSLDNRKPAKVATFDLFQNYPNPFNPETTISYNLSESADVSLTIYNALGQEIDKLVEQHQSPGSYKYNWDAGNKPSGVYFCKLSAAGKSAIRKMLLVR